MTNWDKWVDENLDSEDKKDIICKYYDCECYSCPLYNIQCSNDAEVTLWLEEEVKKVVTNGDALKVLFPGDPFFEDVFLEVMHYSNYKQKVSDWFNAPYKGTKNG